MSDGLRLNYDAEIVDRIRELDQIATDMEERDFAVTNTEQTTLRSADSLTETITVSWRRRTD